MRRKKSSDGYSLGSLDFYGPHYLKLLEQIFSDSRRLVFLDEQDKRVLRKYPKEAAKLRRLNLLGSKELVTLALSYSLYLSIKELCAAAENFSSAQKHVQNIPPRFSTLWISQRAQEKLKSNELQAESEHLADLKESIRAFIVGQGWVHDGVRDDFKEKGARGQPKLLFAFLVRALYQRAIDAAEEELSLLSLSEERNPNAIKQFVAQALNEVFLFPASYSDPHHGSHLSHAIERYRAAFDSKKKQRRTK